jgi:microcystin-dependent protein
MFAPYNVAPNPDDALSFAVPVGSLLLWATSTAPTGYLLCDGSAVSRTLFAHLFAVIGTTWGVGDGTTTFNVPNTGGRVVRGVNGTYTQASTGGLDTQTATGSVTLTANNLPQHVHQQQAGGNINIISSGSTPVQGNVDNVGSANTLSGRTLVDDGSAVTTNSAVTLSVSGSVVNPYISINYIIKSA